MMVEVAGYAMHLAMAASGFFLALIDQREHRLPNSWTYPTAVVLGTLALFQSDPSRLSGALWAALLSAGLFWGLAVVPGKPLGLGDVKLQVVLGFYLGWWYPPLVVVQVFGAFVLGGTAALWLVVIRRRPRVEPLAFGPAMIIATWLTVASGKSLEII
jgi:leader peptidase (prepilin peptidase) / N-methyltransferase